MAFELLFIYLLTYLERKRGRKKERKREREEGERGRFADLEGQASLKAGVATRGLGSVQWLKQLGLKAWGPWESEAGRTRGDPCGPSSVAAVFYWVTVREHQVGRESWHPEHHFVWNLKFACPVWKQGELLTITLVVTKFSPLEERSSWMMGGLCLRTW